MLTKIFIIFVESEYFKKDIFCQTCFNVENKKSPRCFIETNMFRRRCADGYLDCQRSERNIRTIEPTIRSERQRLDDIEFNLN